MNYRIIADSSADLQSFGACVSVPLKIITADCEYVDDESLNVSSMLADLEAYKGKSGSSCPNTGDYLDAFGDAENVFCVTITSGLSGSCNAARAAAESYCEAHPDRRAYVVDSLSAGPEVTLLVLKLQELIDGGMDFDEVVSEIEAYKKTTHLAFALESLHNLANNGRVSPLVAKMAGILGIRVVGKASDEGTLEVVCKVRGAGKVVPTLVEYMIEEGYQGGKVRIHHCENAQLAESLRDALTSRFSDAQIEIQPTRGLCSFYAERGGLLIGYEG